MLTPLTQNLVSVVELLQGEIELGREIVNYTTNNVCFATGALEAAFRSNTALGRVALRKRKVWLFL